MASLESRNGKYSVVFRFGGRKFTRTLKTNDEGEAEEYRLKVERRIRYVEEGTLELPDGTDAGDFLLGREKKVLEVPKETVTLKSLIEEFFSNISEGSLEKTTLDGMKTHKRHLLRVLDGNMDADKLTLTTLDQYAKKRLKDKIKGRTAGPSTVKKELVTFRRVWGWGQRRGKISAQFPAIKDVELPKTKQLPPFQTWGEIESQIEAEGWDEKKAKELWDCLYLQQNEITELLKHVKENANHGFIYPMFVTAAHTGARRSELMRSRKTDILKDTLVIRERKRVRGQETTRRVPMSAMLKKVLTEWVAEHPGGPYTFCLPHVPRSRIGRKKDTRRTAPQPITRDEANDHLKRTLKDSKWKVIRGWHCLRHSFISNLACNRTDQRIIDEFVGHTTEAMRRRYTHLFPDTKRAAITAVFD